MRTGGLCRLMTRNGNRAEKESQGFVLATALGIIGAVVATYLGRALGWYQAGEKAGFMGGPEVSGPLGLWARGG